VSPAARGWGMLGRRASGALRRGAVDAGGDRGRAEEQLAELAAGEHEQAHRGAGDDGRGGSLSGYEWQEAARWRGSGPVQRPSQVSGRKVERGLR
jgi:hypothetical protein